MSKPKSGRKGKIVPPRWDFCLGDLQIMTRILSEIAMAMNKRDTAALFRQLQEMRVYAENLQSTMWEEGNDVDDV